MKRVYGVSMFNQAGVAEDRERCVAEVRYRGSQLTHQCSRKRAYGGNGEYCWQHWKEKGLVLSKFR